MPLLDVNTNLGSVAAAPGITEACGKAQLPRSQVELEHVGSAGNKVAQHGLKLGLEMPSLISNQVPGQPQLNPCLLAVQGTLKRLLQHQSSKASILQCSAFF